MNATASLPPQPTHPESGAWDSVRGGWTHLYGSFEALGASMELHDFQAGEEIAWDRSFHAKSIELCLNITGRGNVSHRSEEAVLDAGSAGLYAQMREPLRANRSKGQRHKFVTLEFSQPFLERSLAGAESAADPVVRQSVFGKRVRSAVGRSRLLNPAQQSFALAIAQPPVAAAVLPLWYESKALEAVATFLTAPAPELFCTRQNRLAQERAERVRQLLLARLTEPPTLEELSREVGVSPFYLSRTFSQETGMTIPQYLRRIRMERAAELLRAGGHNVTEVAFAVGYASLGHFSKSFCEVIGSCPTLYPHTLKLARS